MSPWKQWWGWREKREEAETKGMGEGEDRGREERKEGREEG